MLDTLFLYVLDMTAKGSLVILAVLLLRLCLRKAPKVFSYALWGVVLLLYLAVAATCGAICGFVGAKVTKRLLPIIGKEEYHEET